ncbi:MAG: hypothetical protein A3H98_14415 [Bacteroidetes bacterium RIFCSPLOWO2_02_FULL_36_8]|nr:MAG: hypothetical protein A3H98_14415 [Bacteroidetes bacterium RIFCSPLOWO2_02_FULL_36_8]
MHSELKITIEDTLSKKFNVPVKILSVTAMGGGCINECAVLKTGNGTFFIKWNRSKYFPEMFLKEVKGLTILRRANCISVPEVIACGNAGDDDYLILKSIFSSERKRNFWENFGLSLANIHRNHSEKFGLDHDNYIGSLVQYNEFRNNWVDFFIEQRLSKQIKLAFDKKNISDNTVKKFQKLFPKLKDIFPVENPSLLHGDLWNGNFMSGPDGYAWLIDPAVYYGHREAELAFTKLFGGFEYEFYTSYQNNFPLEPGFDERYDVYNLYPLMVHVNLFGGGYLSSVEGILNRYV